jgi:hypothetical protein
LLPSQQGFGEDLQASNVITPIIDLTPTAEGSALPDYLQTATSFDDVTAWDARNSTTVIANTAGFWRLQGNMSVASGTGNRSAKIQMSDGLSTKDILEIETNASTVFDRTTQFTFYFYLNAGESISAISNDVFAYAHGWVIQVADTNGTLSTPAGFTPQ